MVTLAESHIWTVLSKEDVANMVELGLKRTSVMRREWPSEVLTKPRVSIFHIKTCQKKTAISSKLIQKSCEQKATLNLNTTFFSCPAVARNFPSDEKWLHKTLLLLEWRQLTSPKVKPTPVMTYHFIRIF